MESSPQALCGDVSYEGKRIRMMVVLLLQGLYINIDMTQRRSWTDINLETPDNIYWRVQKRFYTMEKDVLVKTVEDTLIPCKLPIVILWPNRIWKTLP
jgi:hypothetical protein